MKRSQTTLLPGEAPIAVGSFDELLEHEQEIVERIERVAYGGNLFVAHPFRLLADIGVELSAEAREEIVEREPLLDTLVDAPYDAMRNSSAEQNVRIHVRGLFERRET